MIAVTGAAGVITFSGVVAGPPLFGALSALTGSTRSGFFALAALSAAAAIAFAIIPSRSAMDRQNRDSEH